MDTNTTIVIVSVIGLFALIIIGFFLVFRRRGNADITGPLGLNLKVSGSNDPPTPTPGVKVEDASSHAGGLVAEDNTGRGADVKNVEVQNDILVTSTPPKVADNDTSPKV